MDRHRAAPSTRSALIASASGRARSPAARPATPSRSAWRRFPAATSSSTCPVRGDSKLRTSTRSCSDDPGQTSCPRRSRLLQRDGNVHALARAVAEGAAREGAEVRLRHVAELNQEMLISVNQYWGRHRSELEDQARRAARGHRVGGRDRLRNADALRQRRRAAEAVPRPRRRALAAGEADRQGRHGVHVLADRARRAGVDDPRAQQHALPLGRDRAPARVHGARGLQRRRKPVRHIVHE